MSALKNEANPSLRILLEPKDKFRFRYSSEYRSESHGCLQALSSNSRIGKTYPTIELVNYMGTAEIKCRLWQADKDEEHPFRVCVTDTSEEACLRALVTGADGYIIRTPPYEDLAIKSEVKVYMELMRPSDERISEPRVFNYTAACSDHGVISIPAQSLCTRCGIESSSGYNFYLSNDESKQQKIDAEESFVISDNNLGFDSSIGDTLTSYYEVTSNDRALDTNTVLSKNPMLCDVNLSYPVPVRTQPEASSHDFTRFPEVYEDEYVSEDLLNDQGLLYNLTADSGNMEVISSPHLYIKDEKTPFDEENVIKNDIKVQKEKECPAYYKAEDVVKVKKLIKHICNILQQKNGNKIQEIKTKLESLLEIRLSNGDTFLHMTLTNSQQSLEYMVKLIHSMGMPQLLNLTNDLQQTILHLAIVHELLRLVAFLVAKGCDPMLVDADGNNALHYAVNRRTLAPLLEAIENNHVSYDLNAHNNEKQTALHLAAIFDSEESTRLLLDHGANISAQDYKGRTSLLLAVYDGSLNAARVIIASTLPNDIDLVDGQGITTLQIACEVDIKNNSLEIIRLLLEKKADPFKYESHSKPAWKVAKRNPLIWDVISKYADADIFSNNHDTNHSDDEFVSADEGDADEFYVASRVHEMVLMDHNAGACGRKS